MLLIGWKKEFLVFFKPKADPREIKQSQDLYIKQLRLVLIQKSVNKEKITSIWPKMAKMNFFVIWPWVLSENTLFDPINLKKSKKKVLVSISFYHSNTFVRSRIHIHANFWKSLFNKFNNTLVTLKVLWRKLHWWKSHWCFMYL